jgi:cardiolipin synthase
MPRWLNAANLLTTLRLLLVPPIILAVLEGRHERALVLFVLAAATDGLDGFVARVFRQRTQFGVYLDPIADKFLLSGVFLALAAARLIPRWLVVTIFGRDLYILTAAGFLLWLTPARSFPPSIWGKASTFVQVITAVVWITRNAAPSPVLDAVSVGILWPCAAFTIWSGVHYTWTGLRLVRAH